MTEQVSHAVEAIKLAYLSHTPVVWLVTGDKEVASEIVEQFTIEHFGAFRNPNILGRPVSLQQFTEKTVERLSVDETLKYYWDRPLKDFIGRSNIKEFSSTSSDAANVIGLRVALSAIWSPVVRTPAAVVSQEDTLYIG